MAGMMLEGDLYLNRVINNVEQGFIFLGNTTSFTIQEPTNVVERPSKGKGTYGAALSTIYTKTPAQMSFAFDEMDAENVAMAWLGTSEDVNDAAGTLTAVDVTAKLNSFVDIPDYRNLVQSGFTVTDSGAVTTYVLGTDYEVNWALGMIKALPGGAISDAEALKISGTSNALSGKRVKGGNQQLLEGEFRLDGYNKDGGKEAHLYIPKAVFAPNGAIDLKGDGFANASFDGRPVLLPGNDAAYWLDMELESA
jgi:hypothetical protein